MSRFSRSEAEADGWVIVHEDENQGMYRAEKYIDGSKVEAPRQHHPARGRGG